MAHKAPSGGGSAGGDYVTRARAVQLRETIGERKVEVVYRHEPPPPEEAQKEGLRVPPMLTNQHAVNSMLLQQPYKMRISELRAAIEKQQADAARQQEELEAAAMANLSVAEQLQASLGARIGAMIGYLQDADHSGTGMVTRADFVKARHLLRVPAASAADVGAFFDTLDHLGAGELDYAQLARVAKRRAGPGGSSTSRSQASVEPAELDLALQVPISRRSSPHSLHAHRPRTPAIHTTIHTDQGPRPRRLRPSRAGPRRACLPP